MQKQRLSRRTFLGTGSVAGASCLLPAPATAESTAPGQAAQPPGGLPPLRLPTAPKATGDSPFATLDLAPARWIWYPSGRVLPSTFVLFRKRLALTRRVVQATGWIVGDSRYLLTLNGQRIQWGPAPSDPRWTEADPVNLTGLLQPGENVIGAQVLYYGAGDGTWPIGKPGFIFKLTLRFEDGSQEDIVSDASWQSCLARAWQPGHYKRWYLRALQEEFDARAHPAGWNGKAFKPGRDWLPAMALDARADRPAICSTLSDFQFEAQGRVEATALRKRSIPLMAMSLVKAQALSESLWVEWKRPPVEYFESLTPDAFVADRTPSAQRVGEGAWRVAARPAHGAALTFAFEEQIVGWPFFTIEASEGTVVELLMHEGHQPGGPALLNSHFNAWSRFTCKAGVNEFEAFDYESLRWLQLHVHGHRGTVVIRDVGVRRRVYPWPRQPGIACADARLQKVFDACINTLHNSAQETIVDGMGRERQQYSGDCGHQLHAIFHAFGETRLPARYVNTFSQGLTLDGYFLDCWPAYDRMVRLMERQLQLTDWGPILDHSIGFVFDCFHLYLHTGDLAPLAEAFPRLLTFFLYLRGQLDDKGLLPVENLGTPTVWIDHEAYDQQRHKQCAYNLYAAAMAEHALAPLCRAFGHGDWAQAVSSFGAALRQVCVQRFWDAGHQLFVNNRPWLAEDGHMRLCDRSLSTAVLFGQCPGGQVEACVEALAGVPKEMGLSYPANAIWRLWALARGRRIDVVIDEIRKRWFEMPSVQENNTLSENWQAKFDATDQWSHCPVGPLIVLYQGILGIQALKPGFTEARIEPQLGDLTRLEADVHTVQGAIHFSARGPLGSRTLQLDVPAGCQVELRLDARETVNLPKVAGEGAAFTDYRLAGGTRTTLALRFT